MLTVMETEVPACVFRASSEYPRSHTAPLSMSGYQNWFPVFGGNVGPFSVKFNNNWMSDGSHHQNKNVMGDAHSLKYAAYSFVCLFVFSLVLARSTNENNQLQEHITLTPFTLQSLWSSATVRLEEFEQIPQVWVYYSSMSETDLQGSVAVCHESSTSVSCLLSLCFRKT